MDRTVLQAFTDLDGLVTDAEQDLNEAVHNLEDARKRLDELAAQFGFVKTSTTLVTPPDLPYISGSHQLFKSEG